MGGSVEPLRLAELFCIAGHVFDSRNAVIVTLDDGTHVRPGEGAESIISANRCSPG